MDRKRVYAAWFGVHFLLITAVCVAGLCSLIAEGATFLPSALNPYSRKAELIAQTLIAMRADTILAEHENPGEATILVLRGRVRLRAADASWDGIAGDLLVVPTERHSVEALEDAAFVLTVAKV